MFNFHNFRQQRYAIGADKWTYQSETAINIDAARFHEIFSNELLIYLID